MLVSQLTEKKKKSSFFPGISVVSSHLSSAVPAQEFVLSDPDKVSLV